MNMEIYWSPCAQSTITRPMAEAISLVQGGIPVEYFDTQDKRKKEVNAYDLSMIGGFEVNVDGKKMHMNGEEATLLARRTQNIQMNMNINDVIVKISRTTSIDAALAQYKEKLAIRHCLDSQRLVPKTPIM